MTSVVRPVETIQRLLHQLLRMRVEIGGRLIEDEDFRLKYHDAREGNQLPLSGRQSASPLRQPRIIAVRQPLDHLVRADEPACLDHLSPG